VGYESDENYESSEVKPKVHSAEKAAVKVEKSEAGCQTYKQLSESSS
jgi:hypothetical protein